MNKYSNLSIVVPAKNEEKTIRGILLSLSRALPGAQLIVVDNNSSDSTAAFAATVDDVVIVKERRAGKGEAMRTGLAAARHEWVLFHDADSEYEVADAVAVVDLAISNPGCMSVGVRQVGYDKILASSVLAHALIGGILKRHHGDDAEFHDILSGTRCLPTQIMRDLQTTAKKFGIETEMTALALQKGIKILGSPVRFNPRSAQQGKKIKARHLMELVRLASRRAA